MGELQVDAGTSAYIMSAFTVTSIAVSVPESNLTFFFFSLQYELVQVLHLLVAVEWNWKFSDDRCQPFSSRTLVVLSHRCGGLALCLNII